MSVKQQSFTSENRRRAKKYSAENFYESKATERAIFLLRQESCELLSLHLVWDDRRQVHTPYN